MPHSVSPKKGSGQLSLASVDRDTIIRKSSLRSSSDHAQHGSLDVSHVARPIYSVSPADTSLKRDGKRKRLSIEDSRSGMHRQSGVRDGHGSLTTRQMPVMVAGQTAEKRSNYGQDARRSPFTCSETGDYSFLCEVNEDRKRLCRQSASSREQKSCTSSENQSRPNHSEFLPLSLNPTARRNLFPSVPITSTVQGREAIPTSEDAVAYTAPLMPADQTWLGCPLPGLEQPIDEVFFDLQANRDVRVPATQPSTTGSQGFPNFVTAGLDVSSLGQNLFGYDREELMGCISWA